MNILHYALGFPPYRSGGLTKYVIDLMENQKDRGHNVFLMWPGRFSFNKNVRLKTSTNKNGLKSIEIINPQPVPLDEGIKDINEFIKECPNREVFRENLKKNNIDVLHIHTLMGMYGELVEEAVKLNIKVIFTTHDYFGICPKVTLFKNGTICNGDCEICENCNENALSIRKIKIMQSLCYRVLKETKIVKWLRKKHRNNFFVENSISEYKTEESKKKYEELRNYYISILEKVYFHFNSSITEKVYKKYIGENINGKVINITHKGITENKKIKEFNHNLRFLFLGAANPIKGYFKIIEVMDKLWEEGYRFELNTYTKSDIKRPYLINGEQFEYSRLEKIMDYNDLLLAPSLCYETFGFTVEEALCYGVPVIVSDTVGAKDIVEKDYGWVISTKDINNQLEKKIVEIIENRKLLNEANKAIVEKFELKEIKKSYELIEEIYK